LPTRSRKIRRLRGSRTHGWGQVGQHRKTGGQGGAGKAGLLKHKWTWTVKYDPNHFGHFGFRRPVPSEVSTWLNVGQLDELANRLESPKIEGKQVIDLNAMGYEKLLGSGNMTGSYQILVKAATARSRAKVEAAGGLVEVP